MRLRLALVFLLCAASPTLAQDRGQTLADIKAELVALMGQFNALKTELVQSGGASTGAAGGDALQRLDTIEAELMRLTSKTEEIEIKVNSVVRDGTNRIGDIEFRLCEVTEGCDISSLPEIAVLGGDAAAGSAGITTDPALATDSQTADGPELAANEQAEFDRAKGVLGQGDFLTATDLLTAFTQSFPGSPLGPEAHLLRGDALVQLGDNAESARSYLEAYTLAPEGVLAPQALFKLGRGLSLLGQVPEACATLAEVEIRHPTAPEVALALTERQALQCP